MAHQEVQSEKMLTPIAPSTTNKPKLSHVKVFCRVKPLKGNEEPFDMQINKGQAEISIPQPRQETTKTFTFNKIFLEESQTQFVDQCCAPIFKNAFQQNQGYLIFSYGVTNSGKTYTILGSKQQPGILPHLISKLSEKQDVLVSAIELYNDEFFSLTNKQKLQPREQNGFLDFSQCLDPQLINKDNMDEKMKLFINNRTQNQTKMNAKSSRSHAIFKIKCGNVIIGVVDLAGSERTNRVFTSIDETNNINKSLLCLGRCIKALNQKPEGSTINIPYRQSKLTKMLIEYFAAKTEVLMVANINQQKICFHENMKVLDYAVLAKDIRHCTTEFHKKSHSKSMHKSNKKKIDVFQSLYKSASKSNIAHKSLKSSRSKIVNFNHEKHNLTRKQLIEENQQFSKLLKAQQLKMYLERYNSSVEASNHWESQIDQIQQREQQKVMQNLRNFDYKSPVHHMATKQITDLQPRRSIAVGPQQDELCMISEEMKQKMKEQLKKLLEEQRLATMLDETTQITTSFKKNQKQHNKQEVKEEEFIGQYQLTPVKTPSDKKQKKMEQNSKSHKKEETFWSTGKKFILKSTKYIRSCISKEKRKPTLKICNLADNYTEIFNNNEIRMQNSEITFCKEQKQFCEVEVQTDPNEWNLDMKSSFFEEDTQQTSNCSDMSLIHALRVTQVSVRNSEVIVQELKQESEDETESQQQNFLDNLNKQEDDDAQKNIQNEKKITASAKKTRKALKKEKKNEVAKRVAETRKLAARLCRQQSRTPLKNRLRSRKRN